MISRPMVIEEIRTIKSGKKELRQFGITMGVVLGLAGCWLLWRESHWYTLLLITSGAFFLGGILFPAVLKPLHKMWMALALLMGWVVTGVIMVVLFYLVITPIGFLVRLSGRDLLHRKFERGAPSYWIPRENVVRTREDYERQF